MKLAILAKVRNGALVEVLQEKGWNQSDLARAVKVTPSLVSRWMQMRTIPKGPVIRARLERVTGRLFEDLFPPELAAIMQDPHPREVTIVRDVPIRRLPHRPAQLLTPSVEDDALAHETTRMVHAAVDALTPQLAAMVRAYYGLGDEPPQTYAEIGRRHHLSTERIRQLVARAEVQLRERRRTLKPVGALHAWHKEERAPDWDALPPAIEVEAVDVTPPAPPKRKRTPPSTLTRRQPRPPPWFHPPASLPVPPFLLPEAPLPPTTLAGFVEAELRQDIVPALGLEQVWSVLMMKIAEATTIEQWALVGTYLAMALQTFPPASPAFQRTVAELALCLRQHQARLALFQETEDGES